MPIRSILAACTILLLSGCSARPALMPFGTPTYAPEHAKQVHFYDRRDLVTYCVDHYGTFTTDGIACAIHSRWGCEQVTQTSGRAFPQWNQLNAMCNSTWRPAVR